MKKAFLSLLFAGVLALAAPAVQSEAAENIITDSFVLDVTDEPLVEGVRDYPTTDVNPELLTVAPTAYTIGDKTYIFAMLKDVDDECNGLTIHSDTISGLQAYFRWMGAYRINTIAVDAFTGSQEMIICYYGGADGDWLAAKKVTVTAADYEGALSVGYIEDTYASYVSATLPVEAAAAEDLVIAAYDGTTMVGKMQISRIGNTTTYPCVASLMEGIYGNYEGVYSSDEFTRINGSFLFNVTEAGKTYTVKASAGGKEYALGSLRVVDETLVTGAYSDTRFATDNILIAVEFFQANPYDITVQLVNEEGTVVASSANGGQVLPWSSSCAYYELPVTDKEAMEDMQIRVVDKKGTVLYANNTYYGTEPEIVEMYYNYRDKYVVALTNGMPNGTQVEASVEVDGVTYKAVGVVVDNHVGLVFTKDGVAFALPGGSHSIQCKFTVSEQEDDEWEYIYVKGESSTSASYGNMSPKYLDAGVTSAAFAIDMMASEVDAYTGDLIAALYRYDSDWTQVGEEFALTATVNNDYEVPMYTLTGTWTGTALEVGEYLIQIYRGEEEIDGYPFRVYDPAKVYACLYSVSDSGRKGVEVYLPSDVRGKYDLSKFTLQAYDFLGNPIDVQYELAYQGKYYITYYVSNVPADIWGVTYDASYAGQEVYDFYAPTIPETMTVYNEKGPSIGYYSNNDMCVGVDTSEAMKVEVRETGIAKVLKTFTVPGNRYYYTIADLTGLSVDDRSVAYDLTFITLDGKFVNILDEQYLGIKQDAVNPTPTPAPTGDPVKIESFVTRMYEVTLGRTPDAEGMETWKNGLLNGTYTGEYIANGFIMSEELQNKGLSNSEYVDVLYAAFFGRAADPDGKQTWVSLLDMGTSRRYVMAGFVNSVEFDALCADYGIIRGTMDTTGEALVTESTRNFVLRIYEKVLQREGEAQGILDWCVAIGNGTFSAEDAAKLFFFSDEYVAKNTTNEDFVETLYETFMGRPSDPDGKAFWLEQLNGAMTREQVLEGFSRSAEFAEILKTFGF